MQLFAGVMMAKKYNKKKVHGLKPSSGLAIRWLGAYGMASDRSQMVAFEMSPSRPVSVELIEAGKKPQVRARVGLVVDQRKTVLLKAIAGDGWTGKETRDRGYTYSQKSHGCTCDGRWPEAFGLSRAARLQYSSGKYVEGVVSSPVYTAIAVKLPLSDSGKELVDLLVEATGLPVLYL